MRGSRRWQPAPNEIKRPQPSRRRRVVTRLIVVLLVLAFTAGAVVAYKDQEKGVRASDIVADPVRDRGSAHAVQISRSQGGEFALRAKINGVPAPMVIDTGATSVVLTYETAKAAGLPLELLEYDVDVETAGGHNKAARLALDRLESCEVHADRLMLHGYP